VPSWHKHVRVDAPRRTRPPAAEVTGVIRVRPTRLLAFGALLLVAFLYWKPLHTYLRTKHELQTRQAQVQALQDERTKLQQKIDLAGTAPQLVRQARLLGLVRPGERVFIVRGITAWRHRNRTQ
jgi:cell division protein FtsB